jgi:hypothetical protein
VLWYIWDNCTNAMKRHRGRHVKWSVFLTPKCSHKVLPSNAFNSVRVPSLSFPISERRHYNCNLDTARYFGETHVSVFRVQEYGMQEARRRRRQILLAHWLRCFKKLSVNSREGNWDTFHVSVNLIESILRYCHDLCVTIAGAWIGDWIYWPLICTTRNYK